jgi:hypothetical protein
LSSLAGPLLGIEGDLSFEHGSDKIEAEEPLDGEGISILSKLWLQAVFYKSMFKINICTKFKIQFRSFVSHLRFSLSSAQMAFSRV